jgi:hypothetical protein
MRKSHLSRFLAGLALAGAVLMGSGRALADKIHLKDGRVLDGVVTRELDGYVWFKVKVGAIEQEQMFKPAEVASIDRDGPAPKEGDKALASAATPEPEKKAMPGVPRAAIVSLGVEDKEMVGQYITADSLERCIPLLEKEHVDIVVLRINSGGGALLEIQKLSDVIEFKLKPKFRTVAWIEHAISAAAMTAHCMEEIYMMPGASYGACTGWSGQLVAVKGRQLQEILYMMEKISARGKHDPKIMRSMQIMDPLSCSIDENGDVHWYQNLEGQYIVNPEERILCFNSQDAMKYKFAKGIAATYEELGKAMGYAEVQWVGKMVPGTPYPVCEAEMEMRRFRDQTEKDQKSLNEYALEYRGSIGIAQSRPVEDRGPFVNKARQALDKIKRMVKNNHNMALFVLNMLPEQYRDWVDEQEEILRKLMKK